MKTGQRVAGRQCVGGEGPRARVKYEKSKHVRSSRVASVWWQQTVVLSTPTSPDAGRGRGKGFRFRGTLTEVPGIRLSSLVTVKGWVGLERKIVSS